MANAEGKDLLPGLNEELVRHLQAKNEIMPVSMIFGSLTTNELRVNLVNDLLAENKLLPDLWLDGKSGIKSEEHRQKGNEMFKKKKAREAHEFYTKSASFAETGSENLALAYANRSAVLFENGLYEECLKDIESAFQCNYPQHLKPKLIARQTKAKDLLPTQEKVDFFTPVPSIPKEKQNPLIQCAANNVKIEYSETMGRHIIATRDIEPGEILAIEKPFCQVLTDQPYTHCHHCLTVCYTLIPCQKCTEALFCSETCQMNAIQAYHQYECPILRTIKKLDLTDRLIHLRVTLLVRDKYKCLNQCVLDKNEEYRSDRYNEIYNLVPNTSSRSVSDLFNRAVYAAAFYHLLKTFTKFFDNESEDFEATFKELMLLHLQIGACNFHEIAENKSSDNSVDQKEIGAGAYSFLSMFNHSCCPNVVRYGYGPTMISVAIDRIREGEQCFDNYGVNYVLMPKKDRHAYLKRFLFDCTCIACVNNYPQDEGLPRIQDPKLIISLEEIILDYNLKKAKNIFTKVIEKIKKLSERKPNRNLPELQNALEQCFNIFSTIKTPI